MYPLGRKKEIIDKEKEKEKIDKQEEKEQEKISKER